MFSMLGKKSADDILKQFIFLEYRLWEFMRIVS